MKSQIRFIVALALLVGTALFLQARNRGEVFPARIRYTSMSFPYHIGNGVFGGLVPLIGLSLVDLTGNNLAGVAYPMVIAAIGVVVAMKYMGQTHLIRIWDEVEHRK